MKNKKQIRQEARGFADPAGVAVKREVGKMKDLSRSQRLQYIWDYYRWPIIIVVVVLICAVSIGATVISYYSGGKKVFGVAVVNESNTEADYEADYIKSGFTEYLGLAHGKEKVVVNTGYAVTQDDTYYEGMVATLVIVDASMGNVDAGIGQDDVFDYFIDNMEDDVWMDLRTVLSDECMEAVADRLYYTVDAEGNSYPCAIYLGDSHLVTQTGTTLIDPLVGFPVTAKHTEKCEAFIDYALGLSS